MTDYQKPLPIPSLESRPFWDACRRGELVIQRCDQCSAFVFPPRPLCDVCLGTSLSWTRSTGRGRVFSYVVYHRVYHQAFAPEIPYVVAIVELDEGVRLLSNIVGCPPEQVRCELPVEVVFERVTDDTTLFKFQPRPRSHIEGASPKERSPA